MYTLGLTLTALTYLWLLLLTLTAFTQSQSKHERKEKMKTVTELKSKRFKVFVGGEVERTTNWKGIESLLENWSDFPQYTAGERKAFMAKSARDAGVYIDANIYCKAV